MCRVGLGFVLYLCACALGWGSRAAAEPQTPHVLVLNSYHPQYQWTEELVRGVRDEFNGVLPDEHLHIEFMDARHMLSDGEYLAQLATLYANKYGHFPPDVIISSDDSALNFLIERRDAIFPGVPVVFCGINSLTVAELEPIDNMTGILEGLEVEGNLRLIERLHPEARRIVLLSDRTALGQGMQRVARGVASRFVTGSRKIEIWDDFTIDELNQRVSALDAKTVLLLLAIHEDRAGHYFSFTEHLRPLTEHSRVPVYGMFGMLLGQGITGGMMNDAYEHGRATAAMARRVLTGTRADDIPIVPTAAYRPRFDSPQLVRFGIDETRLPQGSFVLNRPVSFYSQHRQVVWGALSVVLALVLAILWLMRVVRRMRQAEHALVESQAELGRAQRLELIGRMAGGIAHDFNNLLVPIISCTDLIEIRLGPALDKARPELETLRMAGSRAAELSRQLLSLARPQPLTKRLVDASAAVRDLERILRRTVSEGTTLSLMVPTEPLWMQADQARIEQIIVNLVVNANDAVLATPSRTGHVWISVEEVRFELPRPDLGLPRGNYVCLGVRDDGVGMSDELLEQIFMPFFSTKQPGRGTGLGLATVRSVAAQHEGAVQVESKAGAGSSLRVFVPRVADSEAAASSAEHAPGARIARRHASILVVEDEPLVRAVTVEALRSAGHRVKSVDDPRHALAALAADVDPCELLVTDLLMPGLNGRELWELMRAEYPAMRVLFMSGYDAGLLESRGATTDDLPFIRKPFSVQQLCLRVDELMAQK